MPAPYNNVRSKLARAVCAYLQSQNCGSFADVVPYEFDRNVLYPITIIRPAKGTPEVPLTGMLRVMVLVTIMGSATHGEGEPNPDLARVNFDSRVAQTFDALMQTSDGQTLRATAQAITDAGRALATAVDASAAGVQLAANNADMADFTCFDVYDAGFENTDPDSEGCSWCETLVFEMVCCGSAVN